MPGYSSTPEAIYHQIRENLQDRYQYRSGISVLKELIQNAEDAKATTVQFRAHGGWAGAHNPLLRVPGLLVVNDGHFSKENGRGILSLGLSDKAGSTEQIGRFGFGQKALFHLCDAFIAHAMGYKVDFSKVVNPCLDLPGSRAGEWDKLDLTDLQLLENEVRLFDAAFILWVPMRRDEILPAPKLSFTGNRPNTDTLVQDLVGNEPALRLMLSGLRNLNQIEIRSAAGVELALQRVDSYTNRMLGPGNLLVGQDAQFSGQLTSRLGSEIKFVGLESHASIDTLSCLYESEEWPGEPMITEDGPQVKSRKAAQHGAVVISAWDPPTTDDAAQQSSIDWGVFLPLGHETNLSVPNRTVRILLHGYFSVDAGRRFIHGFVANEPPDKHSVLDQWNVALRDHVVLPLLPPTLHYAFEQGVLSSEELGAVVSSLRRTVFGQEYLSRVTSRDCLVQAYSGSDESAALAWMLVSSGSRLRPIPSSFDHRTFEGLVTGGVSRWASKRNLTLVADLGDSLAMEGTGWAPEEVASLLDAVDPTVFHSPKRAHKLADFLDVIAPHARLPIECANLLLSVFREALRDKAPRGNNEALTRIWKHLPSQHVIGLPSGAKDRFVLRALASVEGAPTCLSAEWIQSDSSITHLESKQGALLLEALQPLLGQGTQSDAAGVAALEVIRLVAEHPKGDLLNERISGLRCIRATDDDGAPSLLSLRDLVAASREERLFLSHPDVQKILPMLKQAAPGTGVVSVAGKTAEFLRTIPHLIPETSRAKESFAKLVERASSFGTAQAREQLVTEIYSDESGATSGLRVLATGNKLAADPSTHIVALRDTRTRLDSLAVRLLQDSKDTFVVSREIASNLSSRQRGRLGVRDWDDAELGRLLVSQSELLASIELTEDLLTDLMRSGIRNEDLGRLPIFTDNFGVQRTATDLFREGSEWLIPAPLAGTVPRLTSWGDSDTRRRLDELVPEWSPEAQARFILALEDPEHFSADLLNAAAKVPTEHIQIFNDAKWLQDSNGNLWRPKDVLSLHDQVDQAARGHFTGVRRRFISMSEIEAVVREHPGFGRLVDEGVVPARERATARLLAILKESPPIGFIAESRSDLDEILPKLARAGANLELPGWPLLSALLSPGLNRVSEVLASFRGATDQQATLATAYLSTLAELTRSGNDDAWVAYKLAFKSAASWPTEARQQAFGGALVRTADNAFRVGHEVVPVGSGIAASHLLHRELSCYLNLEHMSNSHIAGGPSRKPSGAANYATFNIPRLKRKVANGIRAVLEYASPHTPPGLLAIVVGLFGRTKELHALLTATVRDIRGEELTRIWKLMETQIDANYVVNHMGNHNYGSIRDLQSKTFVMIKGLESTPSHVEIETLSGDTWNVPTVDLKPLEVLGDINGNSTSHREGSSTYRSFSVDVGCPTHTTVGVQDVKALTMKLAEVLIGKRNHQWRSYQGLHKLLDEYSRPDQITVERVSEDIRDHLPTALGELGPFKEGPIRSALKTYMARKNELPTGHTDQGKLQAAKVDLWQEVDTPHSHEELLAAVRAKLTMHGYDVTRVLFELFQNADDAYLQHGIAGKAEFQVEFADQNRLVIRHWGRLINHLGADPEEGKLNGWDQDLLNMLKMNTSTKSEKVTGRFGLGFKSVHLVAQEVGIASRFVACRVRGGLLPIAWELGHRESSDLMRDGRPATIVELIRDEKMTAALDVAFDAFSNSAMWLPVLSRKIRTVSMGGNGTWTTRTSRPGSMTIAVHHFGEQLQRTSIAIPLTESTTIYLCIDSDGPTPLEAGLSRLWQLVPLEEEVRSGWLMNSWEFRLDPGRSHLGGSAEDQHSWFWQRGQVLGSKLEELYDLLTSEWIEFAADTRVSDTRPIEGRSRFVERLYDLFVADLDDNLAKHMHGSDAGIGRLVSTRQALPTKLPHPFASLVSAGAVKYVLTGALEDNGLLKALDGWQALGAIAGSCVSRPIANDLTDLGFVTPESLGLPDLLKLEIPEDRRIGPDLAARIGLVVTRESLQHISYQEREAILQLLSDSYYLMQDDTWRRAYLPPEASISPRDHELRGIIKFAPLRAIGSEQYSGAALGVYEIARDRSGAQRPVSRLLEWASEATQVPAQRAVLSYVVEGDSRREFARELIGSKVTWLPDRPETMRQSYLVEGWSDTKVVELLKELYPEKNLELWKTHFSPASHSQAQEMTEEGALSAWLEGAYNWWQRYRSPQSRKYSQDAYPEWFSWEDLNPNAGELDRQAWFTLFALAIFRTIGRTGGTAHRNFVSTAHREGWWAELARAAPSENQRAWIGRLDAFATSGSTYIDFPQWRRALPDLYATAKWLPDYAEAFTSLPLLARTKGHLRLSDVWKLSASPDWQSRGLEGSPLTQSLGLGANWMIREALRHNFWTQEDTVLLHRYAWSGSDRLQKVFEKFGCPLVREKHSMDYSTSIFDLVKRELGGRYDYFGDFDLPLQLKALNE